MICSGHNEGLDVLPPTITVCWKFWIRPEMQFSGEGKLDPPKGAFRWGRYTVDPPLCTMFSGRETIDSPRSGDNEII
jgi:hypothetical protein